MKIYMKLLILIPLTAGAASLTDGISSMFQSFGGGSSDSGGGIVDQVANAGGSISDAAKGIAGGANYNVSGSSPILGNTDVSFRCNPNFSLPSGSFDFCSITKGLYSLTSGALAFKIGPCDIGGDNPLMCSATRLNKYCQDRLNKPVKNIASEVRKAEHNVLDAGRQKVVITGGEVVAKDTICGITPSLKDKLPEVAKAQNAVTKLNGTPAYGHIANTRQYRLSTECYEAMIKAGKSDADATRYCTPQSIGSTATGSTPVEIEKKSYDTAKMTLANPLKNAASESYEDEMQLRKWIEDSCGKSQSESQATSCANNVISNRYKMQEKLTNIKADIETKEAGRSYLFEGATMHQKTVTHPTEEFKNQLPVEMRRAYVDTAKRAMAQKTVVETFNKRISDTKKELATLMMQKTEMAAKPFYSNVESQKIKQELNNAKAF